VRPGRPGAYVAYPGNYPTTTKVLLWRVGATGSALVAGVATYICWKNEQIFALANEVTTELSKVTWPTRKETVSSTIIVIITTIVASALLGLFDATWSWVTRMIYG